MGRKVKGDHNLQRKRRRKRRKRIILILLILFLLLLLGGAAACFALYSYANKVIEESAIEDLETDNMYSLIYQKTTIYDKEGEEIDALYLSGGNRTLVKYEDLPEDLINALVDTEDKTFWEHHGFNYIRMIGAVKEKIFGGGQISGTSTITQQLARNIYLAETKSERSLERKILEMHYTKILEQELTKKQILEAYFNAVYFGFNAYGIQAASESYFNKEPKDLDLLECAALAALPQSPDTYALAKAAYGASEDGLPVLGKGDGVVYLYNGTVSDDRRKIVLANMKEAGHITEKEYKAALSDSLEKHMAINTKDEPDSYSYYIDCAIDEAVKDIAQEYDVSEEEARTMVYTKGYNIYTCLDRPVQDTLDKQINKNSNYATISSIRKDGDGNIISESGDVLMRPKSAYFDKDGKFKLKKKEFTKGGDGSITLKKGKRLDFYGVQSGDEEYVSIGFKSMYSQDDGSLYFREGGTLSVPAAYTKFDGDGNCVISASFMKDFPDFFKEKDGKLIVSKDNYQLGQKMRQPQAAAVIIDNDSGEVLAMTGGRGASGKQLYNRAISPRQPGSSIKPIGVYAPALQKSADAAKKGEKPKLKAEPGDYWGDYITASSIINDAPMKLNGKIWPKNSGGGFSGPITLRHSVQQSVNVTAVKVFRQVGVEYSVKKLKQSGITSIVEEGGTSDMHDALALGGMTKGISPLEMTAAYETFASHGEYKEPVFYTSVTDSEGVTVIENYQETEQVFDEGVAWIMADILKSAVQYGTGTNARIDGYDVAGKTGTTSSQHDVWFSGFTPKYSMALWMGCDVNIPLANYSSAAAAFWSQIMRRVCDGMEPKHFLEAPDSVVNVAGEWYVDGTDPPPPPPPTEEDEEGEEGVEGDGTDDGTGEDTGESYDSGGAETEESE